MSGSIKKSGNRIAESVGRVILVTLAILMFAGIAWGIYEWILAWRPYWAAIATFCLAIVAGSFIADPGRGGKELKKNRRIIRARSLVIAGLIFIVFVWRIYELIGAGRPYWGTIVMFCVAFAAGLLISLHARWEKGWRMDPRLKKILRPVGYSVGYTCAFIIIALQSAMIVGAVISVFEGVVSHWKTIAWCIGGVCIGGLTLLVIAVGFSECKDRMRKRA
jgi:hypothetical protein